jgi:hypothetical protein
MWFGISGGGEDSIISVHDYSAGEVMNWKGLGNKHLWL